MGAPASRSGSRPTAGAAKASPAKPSIPSASEWHLICITRKGKVSILKNLDLRSARETYKKLLPSTHPEDHQFCEECSKKNGGGFCYSSGWCSSSNEDRLDRIEIVGPEGADLDPWHGVAPKVFFHCDAGTPIWDNRGNLIGHVPPHPKPEPAWDEGRADFWNNPKLWEGIDPTRQMCWRRTDERVHCNGAGDGSSKHRNRGAPDLGGSERPKSRSPERRTGKAPRSARRLNNAALQSERTGA